MTVNILYNRHQQDVSLREMEIVQLLSLGYNSKEIGNKLFISELTVQTHRRNLIKKLGLRNSHQLILWAFKEKMLAF